MHANGDDLIAPGDVDLGHRHVLPKHPGHERQGEAFFNHGKKSASLLRFAVGIRGRLLDQFIQMFRAEFRRCFYIHHCEDIFQRPALARRRTKAPRLLCRAIN